MHLELHWAAFLLHSISSFLSIYNDTGGQKRNIYVQQVSYKTNVTTHITQESVGSHDILMWIFVNELITALSHAYALVQYYTTFKDPCVHKYKLSGQVLVYDGSKCDDPHEFELMRRTLEYTATAAILPIALVLGVSDIALTDVIFIFVINAVIQWLGLIGSRLGEIGPSLELIGPKFVSMENFHFLVKTEIIGAAFLLLAAEVTYVSILLYGVDYSVFTSSAFYIVIGIMYMVFYISFGLVKLANVSNYIEDEIYIILSVTCKISLSWLLIANTYSGYNQLCGTSEVCDMVKKSALYGGWFAWQIVFLIFGSLGLLWSGYMVYRERNVKRKLDC